MNVCSRVDTKDDDRSEVLWDDGERVFCRERGPDVDGKFTSVLP